MAHLTPAAFIDLLDKTVDESATPHLGSCAACRERLADLRRLEAAAGSVDVPEPSPLFWSQLSARVRDAVAAETAATPWWWRRVSSWRFVGIAGGAVAVVAVAVAVQLPRAARVAPAHQETAVAAVTGRVDEPTDDDSLQFVADLAGNMDWDDAADAGLMTRDSGDRAVADMSQSERAELERLLNQALSRGGA